MTDTSAADVHTTRRRMTAAAVTAAVAAALLWGAQGAAAFISGNTIDRHATYGADGSQVRATGPIGCTRGERISIAVTVTQPATAARASRSWKRRCTGELQHWQVRARTRRGTIFEHGSGRVCAVATTRRGDRVTDTRRWCEPVRVTARF